MLSKTNDIFSILAENSIQERKYVLAESIRHELFLELLTSDSETTINSSDFWTTFHSLWSFKEAS